MFARTAVRPTVALFVLVTLALLAVLAVGVHAEVAKGSFGQHWLDSAPVATPAGVDRSPRPAVADDGSANKKAALSRPGSQAPARRADNPPAAASGGPADAGPDVIGGEKVPFTSCGPKPCQH